MREVSENRALAMGTGNKALTVDYNKQLDNLAKQYAQEVPADVRKALENYEAQVNDALAKAGLSNVPDYSSLNDIESRLSSALAGYNMAKATAQKTAEEYNAVSDRIQGMRDTAQEINTKVTNLSANDMLSDSKARSIVRKAEEKLEAATGERAPEIESLNPLSVESQTLLNGSIVAPVDNGDEVKPEVKQPQEESRKETVEVQSQEPLVTPKPEAKQPQEESRKETVDVQPQEPLVTPKPEVKQPEVKQPQEKTQREPLKTPQVTPQDTRSPYTIPQENAPTNKEVPTPKDSSPRRRRFFRGKQKMK